MEHEWWCPESADDCSCDPDVMGHSGGADLAEIRCDSTRHVGCDHDPDRAVTATGSQPSGGEGRG